MKFESFNHFKSVIAHKFFVAPADEDYVLARFCRCNGILRPYLWHAAQAVEKLLKASILLQGCAVKNQGHNLKKLYEQYLDLYGDAAFESFCRPSEIPENRWNSRETVKRFIVRLEKQGDPASRYAQTSYYWRDGDLFLLDQLVFELRRKSVGLEWTIGRDWEVHQEDAQKWIGETWKVALKSDSQLQARGHIQLKQEKIFPTSGKFPNILFGFNHFFSNADGPEDPGSPPHMGQRMGPLENSFLELLLRHAESNSANSDSIIASGLAWMVESIKVDNENRIYLSEWLANPITKVVRR